MLSTRADESSMTKVTATDFDAGSDESEVDDDRHGALLDSIGNLSAETARRDMVERGEALPEGQFNLKNASKTLELADLLGSLKDGKSLGGLKQRVDKMESQKLTMSKPLSTRETNELTRKLAYSKSKADVSKWTATIKANREADHLSFPLNGETTRNSLNNRTSNELADKTAPTTDLEKTVASILEGSMLSTEREGNQLTEAEELGLKGMSHQERRQRVRELQKLRALESYYSSKQRRIKKIKSKSYRRIQKRARAAEAEKLSVEQVRDMDPELAQERALKEEKARILNRASLRHKNTSKWAKQMLGRNQLDTTTRKAIAEQLQIDTNLRKKVTMESDSENEGGDDDGDGSGSDYEDGDDGALRTDVDELRDSLANPPEAKGVMALKFMRRAMDKKRIAAVEELADFEAEVLGEGEGEAGEAATETGRRVFGGSGRKPKAKSAPVPMFSTEPTWDSSDVPAEFRAAIATRAAAKTDGFITIAAKNMGGGGSSSGTVQQPGNAKSTVRNKAVGVDADVELAATAAADHDVEGSWSTGAEENPWLSAEKNLAGLTPQEAMTKFSKKADKRRQKLQRASRTSITAGDVTVDLAKATEVSVGGSASAAPEMRSRKRGNADLGDDGNVDGAEAGTAFNMNANGSSEQQQLIARAFAGDQVLEEDFEKEKAQLVDKETAKDEDVTLPGWGSWAGKGVKDTKPQRRVIKKAAPQAERKDGALKHVIITERLQRKAERKKVQGVPFPYTSKQQFERSIRQPIGKEWNSSSTVQRLVKPKVTTNAGTIIEPMRLTTSVKKAAQERQNRSAKKAKKSK
jgi:U3 small nucleolar RNA-associated protein 14